MLCVGGVSIGIDDEFSALPLAFEEVGLGPQDILLLHLLRLLILGLIVTNFDPFLLDAQFRRSGRGLSFPVLLDLKLLFIIFRLVGVILLLDLADLDSEGNYLIEGTLRHVI